MECSYGGRTLPAASISIGIAQWPEDGGTPEELIGAADSALYSAKHGGRDQVSVSEPDLKTRLRRRPISAGNQATGDRVR